MISQLYPFPGSKSDAKYDKFLYPAISDTAVCEAFAGSCARSLINHRLKPYLGEINPAQRAIALAVYSPNNYTCAYRAALSRFWTGAFERKAAVLAYAGKKNSQSLLSKEMPEVCKVLTQNWQDLTADIYQWMNRRTVYQVVTDTPHLDLAGYYAFAIRACFGNVMRLNPKGTHFNVSWHVDKLVNATQYSPQKWLNSLQAINWNPNVFDCWEDAIAAVPNPESTYLLLDPPYVADYATQKMTPCYSFGHNCTTNAGMEKIFNLAVDSLKIGLERGFTTIDLCNYYVPRLDAAVKQLAADADYKIQYVRLGECNALGNSNGRRKHGQRVDNRERPVEVIYRISRIHHPSWGNGASQSQNSKSYEQLVFA